METFKQHMIHTLTHMLANIGWGIEGVDAACEKREMTRKMQAGGESGKK